MALLAGCSSFNMQKCYFVVSDNYGNSYRSDEWGKTLEIYYNVYDQVPKTYRFQYRVYAGKAFVTEGSLSQEVSDAYPGRTFFMETIEFRDGDELKDVRWLCVAVNIEETPGFTPDVAFDENGGKTEGAGSDLKYVYRYDGKQHFPCIELQHKGQEMNMELPYWGVSRVESGGKLCETLPTEPGEYTIRYFISKDDYINYIDEIDYSVEYTDINVAVSVEIRK